MKKNFRFAFVGAIALLGAVGISSCSSSNDEVIDNPNYDPETNTVKTEFTLSLPNYFGSSTRQTATVAQTTGNFRGMQDMVLIPYNTTVSGETKPWKEKVFNIGIIGATAADGNYWNKETQKAKVYKNLDVPIGTNRFMFYGQATTSGTDYFTYGKLNALDFSTDAAKTTAASDINFALQPILSSYTFSETGDAKGWTICEYLKAIRVTTGISSTALISLLNSFQPKAASSASVQAAVDALWKQVIAIEGLSDADKNTIKGRIEGDTQSNATIDASNNVTLSAVNLTGYPANLYLPDGAVVFSWSNADPSVPSIKATDNLEVADLTKFVYPAALYYRANSTIGVSNKDNVSEKYGSYSWSEILSSSTEDGPTYTWTDASVSANTRSIALHDQIQYAVGRLDLSIQAVNGTLYDAEGQAVTVDGSGFPVSAVFVGGQKNVGYDFTPNSSSTTYTIYDKIMNGTIAAKGGSAVGTNHTLVLETTDATKQVNVAVELTNNSDRAFRGKDGIVPKGGKFYLVGILDLNAASGVTHPTAGVRSKVFEQDYTTTATFTIIQGTSAATPTPNTNTTGLGAAFNVLPDLAISQLEVAFSVDLDWTPGITFEVNL